MESFLEALSVIAGVFAFGSLVALVIERLVEKLLSWPLKYYGWASEWKAYAAFVLAALFSGLFAVDLFSPLAVAVGLQPFVPWAGYALTALAVGGGSQLMHDAWPGQGGSTFTLQTTSPEKSASTTDVVVRTSQEGEE